MIPFPGFIESFPSFGLFILLILGVIGFPFPEDAILLTCGFLVSRGSAEPSIAFLSVYSGLLLTDFFLYSIGRKYGRMIVTNKRFGKILSPKRLDGMERAFNKRGLFVILFGRQVLGIRSQVLLMAGVMKMPSRTFFLSDAASALVTVAIMTGAGYLWGNNLEVIRQNLSRGNTAVLILLAALFVIYIAFRYLRLRHKKTVQPDVAE
jgi:membrane protein DedA with SNARE-associated domain